jgi:starch synthase
MKVLLAASECSPLVKVGGIADVVGSLPIALKQLGIDIRVVLPYYKPFYEKVQSNPNIPVKEIAKFKVPFNNVENLVTVCETTIPNTDIIVYLLYNDQYLSNGGVYYSPDAMPSTQAELDRFAFFSRAISDIFTYPDSFFHPDIIHCNDWHTGLLPEIIKSTHKYNSIGLPKTIFTIHNLGYQGFSNLDVIDKLGIDINQAQLFKWDAQDDNLDFVLQGIIGADYVTTVSEHYAKEIQSEEYGEGLHEILQTRTSRLSGILNGISYDIFDPLKDSLLFMNYTVANYKDGKLRNKLELQKQLGIEMNPQRPMVGVISRLATQKGLDMVADQLPAILNLGYQFVLLGTGDPNIETQFKEYSENPNYKRVFSANLTFSEEFARKIYAASDMFLIPSRYEPSGLTQMIAMKYGSVPVVRATGGLYDTVENGITGYTFDNFSAEDMLGALKTAFIQFTTNKTAWDKLVKLVWFRILAGLKAQESM